MDAKDAIKQQRAQILARKMAAGNPDDTFTGPECKAVLDSIDAHKIRVQDHDLSVDRFAHLIHNAGELDGITLTVEELKWLLRNAEDVRRRLTFLFFESPIFKIS